jgi:Glycosyltransferases involved in cell wall biogenesis
MGKRVGLIRLSFIIPCYNAERYIDACLESVYKQDVTEDVFEVICVDDCSTDETRERIRPWQARHSNLHLISHTENRRQGAARNTGIRAAKGEYVWFVDSDDSIKENCLGTILNTLDDNNLDLLLFNPTEDESRIVCQCSPVSGMAYLEKWLRTGKLCDTMYCVWARIISRELIIKHNLFFREDMVLVEDVSYSYKNCCYSERAMAISDSYYVYCLSGPSVTRSSLTAKKVFSGVFLNLQELLAVSDLARVTSPFVAESFVNDARWWLSRLLRNYNLFAKMSLNQQIAFLRLCRENGELINEIVSKAGVKKRNVFNPIRLYALIPISFFKRFLKELRNSIRSILQ